MKRFAEDIATVRVVDLVEAIAVVGFIGMVAVWAGLKAGAI